MKHTFSKLLLVFVAFALAFSAAAAPHPVQAASQPTIVEIALAVNAQTGEFSTLIAALDYAGFVPLLNSNRQFTVFAPTDAAFAALGLNASNITSVPLATLKNILLFHVSPGERFAAEVVQMSKVRMMNRTFANIEVNSMGAYIDGAKIIATDIDARNGVIHIIDAVMLP